MIVWGEKRRILITPPHTGSRALHTSLCGRPGVYWVVGPTPNDVIEDQHYAHWPHVCPEWEGYAVACVWRDPCSRLSALYGHYVWLCQRQGWPVPEWPTFCQWVAGDTGRYLSWFYRYTIARLLGPLATRVSTWIRYENLQPSLSVWLGEPVSIPWGVERSTPQQWTDDTYRLLASWTLDDYRLTDR